MKRHWLTTGVPAPGPVGLPGDPGARGGWATALISALLLVPAITLFLVIGIFGRYGAGGFDLDLKYLEAAGLAWLSGKNPYDFDQYRGVTDKPLECTFAYAPTSAALFIPLAALPEALRSPVFRGLNIAAAMTLAGLLAAWARRGAAGSTPALLSRSLPTLAAAMVLASPAVASNLIMGQTSLLAVVLLGLAWLSRENGYKILAGILAGVASFKPSIGIFVYVVLLLERQKRTLAALVVTGLLMASVPLILQGPVPLARDWLAAMREYAKFPQNQPGYPHSFGLQCVLHSLGVAPVFAVPVALAGFVWSWRRRAQLTPLELLGVSLVWAVLFLRAHGYDVVALLPFLVAAVIAARGTPVTWAAALGLSALLYPPSGPLKSLVSVELLKWYRELVALVLLAVFIVLVEKRIRRPVPMVAAPKGEDDPR